MLNPKSPGKKKNAISSRRWGDGKGSHDIPQKRFPLKSDGR